MERVGKQWKLNQHYRRVICIMYWTLQGHFSWAYKSHARGPRLTRLLDVKWKIWIRLFQWFLIWPPHVSLKIGLFWKLQKYLKNGHFMPGAESLHLVTFFKMPPFEGKLRYWHETKAREDTKQWIWFRSWKLLNNSNHFWDIQIWKLAH